MDDNGYLRKPTWLRAWPLEDRIQFARVPRLFRAYMDDFGILPDEAKSWCANYKRGDLVVLRSRDTALVAKWAAGMLADTMRQGESGRWISTEGYVEMYKEEWGDEDQGERWRQLKYITRGFDVLVLDGLGEEPNTDFERKILASLIKGRYEREKTTIITTSRTFDELEMYGGRVAGYMMEGTLIKHGR